MVCGQLWEDTTDAANARFTGNIHKEYATSSHFYCNRKVAVYHQLANSTRSETSCSTCLVPQRLSMSRETGTVKTCQYLFKPTEQVTGRGEAARGGWPYNSAWRVWERGEIMQAEGANGAPSDRLLLEELRNGLGAAPPGRGWEAYSCASGIFRQSL